jgi:putative spermidine/putrescine transport system ATP-binding protein
MITRAETSGIPIRLERCAKTFHKTRVLEPLDLDIEAGETLALLGPSGCGKTTTLRIIAGLESPDEGGRVFFGADDVTPVPIERRNVGMVFQSYALFPNMSVVENIEYGLRIRKMASAERSRRAKAMLEMMAIGPLRDRRIDQLSGGQRQRVALARALAPQPRVLLLDEPLTALDARLRDTLRTEIDRLLRSLGVTAIYVTHDQSEAMALGDRIAVMNHGKIAQIGKPQDIYFRPADAFVADFIGSMNLLKGEAKAGRVMFATGSLPLARPQPDGPVTVMFRPEDVVLGSLEASPLHGRVAASFFLGDQSRVIIEAGEQTILARVAPRVAPNVGDPVGVNVAAEAILMEQAK